MQTSKRNPRLPALPRDTSATDIVTQAVTFTMARSRLKL